MGFIDKTTLIFPEDRSYVIDITHYSVNGELFDGVEQVSVELREIRSVCWTNYRQINDKYPFKWKNHRNIALCVTLHNSRKEVYIYQSNNKNDEKNRLVYTLLSIIAGKKPKVKTNTKIRTERTSVRAWLSENNYSMF